MAIKVDTHLEVIDLAIEVKTKQAIKDICDLQAQRDEGRRLAAAFEVGNRVFLIFQIAADNP